MVMKSGLSNNIVNLRNVSPESRDDVPVWLKIQVITRNNVEKIARLHAKAKHRRDDFLHQIAVRLVKAYDMIAIEDLDIAAMKKGLKLGKSVSDVGWGKFVQLLEELCNKFGNSLSVQIDGILLPRHAIIADT